MAQRDDARVAEDQVERHREERDDGDLADDAARVPSHERRHEATAATPMRDLPSAAGALPARLCGRDATVIWSPRGTNRPCGPAGQDDDHQRVDDEGAELGHVVLAAHVGHAQQQGGEQSSPGKAALM